jgi:hypothetical protein
MLYPMIAYTLHKIQEMERQKLNEELAKEESKPGN